MCKHASLYMAGQVLASLALGTVVWMRSCLMRSVTMFRSSAHLFRGVMFINTAVLVTSMHRTTSELKVPFMPCYLWPAGCKKPLLTAQADCHLRATYGPRAVSSGHLPVGRTPPELPASLAMPHTAGLLGTQWWRQPGPDRRAQGTRRARPQKPSSPCPRRARRHEETPAGHYTQTMSGNRGVVRRNQRATGMNTRYGNRRCPRRS